MTFHEIQSPRKTMSTPFLLSQTNDQFSPPKTTLQTFSESTMQEIIEKADTIIANSKKFTSIFRENKNDAQEFMTCVDQLRKVMHFLISQHSSPNSKLVQANKLMKMAMLRLGKEFSQILSSQTQQYSFAFDKHIDIEDEIRIPALIAQSMISSGYSKECVEIYKTTRKSIVEEKIYQLWNNQTSSESLKHQVNKWIHATTFAVTTIFNGEITLCDQVFAVSETINQTCIAYIIKESATNLFKFPEIAISKSKRSPENIFLVINMLDSICNIWTDIESVFAYESLASIKLQAFTSLQKLKESIQTLLCVFTSSIQKNSSKKPVPGGGIHPLTISVMDYVSSLAENSEILSEILATDEDNSTSSSSSNSNSNSNSTLTNRFERILLMLLCKIDNKAKLYNDVALSYLFLTNNLQFVIERVNTNASLKALTSEQWSIELNNKLEKYANNYESVAWGNVYTCLAAEKLTGDPSYTAVERRFTRFESAFTAAHRKQKAWVIPNRKLRDQIKASVRRKVTAAYTEFYNSNVVVLGEVKLEFLVRFSPDNLGGYLSDLFGESDGAIDEGGSVVGSSSDSVVACCI